MKLGIREMLIVLSLVGLPVGSWWFVFRPQNAHCEETHKQIETKQAKLRELNRATGTLGDLRQRIKKLEEGMQFFRSKLPSEKEIDKVLKGIWSLAESNNLRTKSIRPPDQNRNTHIAVGGYTHCEQPVSVELEGSFMGFYGFLQALENQPRIMRISKMKLEKLKTGTEGDIKAEFTMTIFFEQTE